MIALAIRRPRGWPTILLLWGAAFLVLLIHAASQGVAPEFALPVYPAFIVGALAALAGDRRHPLSRLRGGLRVRVVGVVLVHNEDVFVEGDGGASQAFCDRIYAFDHVSTDRTGEVLSGLTRDLDHVTVQRTDDAREAHRVVEPYAGSETWVLGIDGDELYDPDGLARLRPLLEQGAYADAFDLKAYVLNCTSLDAEDVSAAGHMSPPSRPVTKLFNLAAVESWSGCPQRLHGGAPRVRPGFDWSTLRYVSEETDWSTDPLRMLHACFLRRSSFDEDVTDPVVRRNLSETGAFRRGARGLLHRLRSRRASTSG